MRDLWTIFGQLDNCLFVMMAGFTILFGAWVAWIRDHVRLSNTKMTTGQYYQTVFAMFMACMCGILALGLVIAHDNAIRLLEVTGTKPMMYDLARQVQAAILWVLRLMM